MGDEAKGKTSCPPLLTCLSSPCLHYDAAAPLFLPACLPVCVMVVWGASKRSVSAWFILILTLFRAFKLLVSLSARQRAGELRMAQCFALRTSHTTCFPYSAIQTSTHHRDTPAPQGQGQGQGGEGEEETTVVVACSLSPATEVGRPSLDEARGMRHCLELPSLPLGLLAPHPSPPRLCLSLDPTLASVCVSFCLLLTQHFCLYPHKHRRFPRQEASTDSHSLLPSHGCLSA